MVKKNSIPDRWRSLTAVGQRVPGSRFIAFKVPLKGVTNQRVTQTQKFTPKDLIAAIRSQNEELGLIIDLTNTERYYTTKDLPKSVQYVKLHTAGLKIPDDATIHQFKRVVYKFLAANSDNDKLIGVHCTTGINRTGHLICRYLIDVDGWRPLTALSAFGQARSHPIEGTVYIEDIVKGPPRSNAGIDLPPTIEETRAWDTGTLYESDKFPKPGDTVKPLLELIPGNEHADFDARDRRPVPLRDEYHEGRDFFSSRPELRGRRPPLEDMAGDLDLRERRPGDYNPDGRFNPELESLRPLLDARDRQRPRGLPHEHMLYDDRYSGLGYPEYDEVYDEIEAEYAMWPLNHDLDFRERVLRHPYYDMEDEGPWYDPREWEAMNDSYQGPFHERMNPRNARPLEGPMNARRAQLRGGEPLNNMMNPRDRRDMEGPIPERMHPRDPRFMEGAVNERYPQRDAQGNRNAMDDRMRLDDVMEGPGTSRQYPRDPQQTVTSTIERMQATVARLKELPVNKRSNPREAQRMENPMVDQIPQRDARALNRSAQDMMPPRDPRTMEAPMTARVPPRVDRPMEGTSNDQTHAREGAMYESATLRDPRTMEGPRNEQMYQRDAHSMEGPRNEQMYQRDAHSMQGPMNEQMNPRDPRTMEGFMNEKMYQRGAEYPVTPQRDFMSDPRPFEGRKMNPSEDSLRGANRFTPYPPVMKPAQPPEVPRGMPRPDNRDPRDMPLPPPQEPVHFQPRSRFN
ncbi:hypothetical protein GDO81_004224 [Engystomops pustulosus]|uniref:RNA/RNP complex-1-interacting phosphatase n=1 Tax=Engystomops pustulosus TaxID=76066 RepID=A0AAV6ZQU3_ENGPU|nr:hypothetical protein GDO81_004224 [Engystomops pustulosus]